MNKKLTIASVIAAIVVMPTFAVDDPVSGDKRTTSQPYVYNRIQEETQIKIPAANPSNTNIGNTVITYTNVEGGGVIGERELFTGGEYDADSDSGKLITASALNSAFTNLPTTDTTKLVCANQADGCTLWTITDQTAYGETITLPEGYTHLAYIESTGTQYIDTGNKLNTNTDDIEIIFQAVSDRTPVPNMNLFGARGSTTSMAYTLGVNSGGWRFGWGNSSPSVGTADTNKHAAKIEHNNGVLKIDGVAIDTRGNVSIITPTTATLFGVHATSSTTMYYGNYKIYSYKKWTDGELVQNFIPVKNSSNEIGMYDTVSEQFFRNRGSGTFTAGPVVQ